MPVGTYPVESGDFFCPPSPGFDQPCYTITCVGPSPPPPPPSYCIYNNVGWCNATGGIDTAITNADGSQATSLEQCWDLCSAQYGSALVSADFLAELFSVRSIWRYAVLLPECVHEHHDGGRD